MQRVCDCIVRLRPVFVEEISTALTVGLKYHFLRVPRHNLRPIDQDYDFTFCSRIHLCSVAAGISCSSNLSGLVTVILELRRLRRTLCISINEGRNFCRVTTNFSYLNPRASAELLAE